MSNICGIDPGLEGAYAILDGTGNIVVAGRLATLEHGKRPLIDAKQLWEALTTNAVVHTVIENVATRPGQGIASNGAFMRAVGAIWGAAQIHSGSTGWVTPQTWKRFHGLPTGSTKEDSRLRALAIWPHSPQHFTPTRRVLTKKQAQDVAEAALIARWYYETRGKKVRDLLGGKKRTLVRDEVA